MRPLPPSESVIDMRAEGQSGFTLMEIMIAILILGTVLTTVYAAYTGTLRIVKETQHADETYDMARMTLKLMTEDLASVQSCGGVFIFHSLSSDIADADFTELAFLSSSHLDFDNGMQSGNAMIHYYVKEIEPGSHALFRKDTLFRWDEEKTFEREGGYMVCDRLESLAFLFYGSDGEEYETWDSDENREQEKNKAPAVVRIDVAFTRPGEEVEPYRFRTAVYIPMMGGK